eukprot:COSAG05_NODE_2224_length_3369_cov_40.171254_2_plen_79_part_00
MLLVCPCLHRGQALWRALPQLRELKVEGNLLNPAECARARAAVPAVSARYRSGTGTADDNSEQNDLPKTSAQVPRVVL